MANYTVTEEGIYFDAPVEAHGHVDVRWQGGSKAVHFSADDSHPGKAWIGKDFMPWSAFDVPDGARIEWAQYSGSDHCYGESSYPATEVRAASTAGGIGVLWVTAAPAGSRRIVSV